MIKIDQINTESDNPTSFSSRDIADFLHQHLDEYGDEREHILSCLRYAYGEKPGQGGLVLVAHEQEQIAGTVIINHTNMAGYIPEHILVYIAVHEGARGQGLGKRLMERTIEATEGDIALHVEPDNPAKYLYEKFGFTNKYLEMRLKK